MTMLNLCLIKGLTNENNLVKNRKNNSKFKVIIIGKGRYKFNSKK